MKNHHHTRLKRVVLRVALLGACVGPAWVIASEVTIELRPRTDANAESDRLRWLETQKKLLEPGGSKGLSDLVAPSANPSVGSHSIDSAKQPQRRSRCLLSLVRLTLLDSRCDGRTNRRSTQHQPHARDRESTSLTTRAIHLVVRRRCQPSVSIPDWQPSGRVIIPTEARVVASSSQWRPVSTRMGANDLEARQVPRLSTSDTLAATDSSVVPANFQSPSDATTVPTLPLQSPLRPFCRAHLLLR